MDNLPIKCDRCGATGNPRTGQPFTPSGLAMHGLRCSKRHGENHGVDHGKNTIVGNQPMGHGGSSTKSPSSTVADPTTHTISNSSEEDKKAVPEEEESVAALWTKYKNSTEETEKDEWRFVFTRKDHIFMSKNYRTMSVKERQARNDVIVKLRRLEAEDRLVAQGIATQLAQREANKSPARVQTEERDRRYIEWRADSQTRWLAEIEANPEVPPTDDPFMQPPKPTPTEIKKKGLPEWCWDVIRRRAKESAGD